MADTGGRTAALQQLTRGASGPALIQRREVDVPGLDPIRTEDFTERMLTHSLIPKYLSQKGTYSALEQVLDAIDAGEVQPPYVEPPLKPEDIESPEVPAIAVESPGAKAAMGFEEQINKQDNFKTYVKTNAKSIVAGAQELTLIAQKSTSLPELLQIYRFLGTNEFAPALSNAKTKRFALELKQSVEKKLQKHLNREDLLSTCILDNWGVKSLVMESLLGGEVKNAKHGANTSMASIITMERLAQTVGECRLIVPILDKIWKIARECEILTEPAHFAPLILRVLEGSVRRFKAVSILELMMLFYQNEDEYLRAKVTPEADTGVITAMRLAMQGEGHRAKEQKKMFLAMLQHLRTHPEDSLIDYEPDTGEANYDLAFSTGTDEVRILEVETVPADRRADAYNFYRQKFAEKLKSIKSDRKGSRLYLVIPPLTLLPRAEIQKIKRDPELRIANINEIRAIEDAPSGGVVPEGKQESRDKY